MQKVTNVSICATLAFAVGCMLPPALADERQELTRSLRAAELSFADSVARQDIEAFVSHIDEGAIFVTDQVLEGRDAILEAWSGFFAEGGPKLEWHPESVVVREGGQLGLSRGPYTLTFKTADGADSTQKGQFISIWQRQPDGQWKIIFDSGCPPCPDCAAQ